MIGIINWLKGFLRITITGKGTERFLNLCGNKNIVLWDIVHIDDGYELSISIKAFKGLRPIVRKTKVKVVIREREGLPFFVSTVNKRKIFLLGSIFAVFVWAISGYFLWNIEITGNYYITKEQIEDYLYENNIHIGMQKKKLHIESLEENMRATFPQIKWISGKLDGTTLLIDLKESEIKSEQIVFEENVSYNLVAHVDGQIESIIVREGIPKVKQGDLVTKDTVLVEGLVPVMNDDGTVREELTVKSDADIYIRYEMPYEEKLPQKYIAKQYTGRTKKISYIRFGEKEILLGKEPNYLVSDTIINEGAFQIFKQLRLPIRWGSFTHREYLNKEVLYSKEEASEILREKFMNFLDSLSEKGVQIIEKDVKIEKDNLNWLLRGSIIVSEPVRNLVPYEKSLEGAMEKTE